MCKVLHPIQRQHLQHVNGILFAGLPQGRTGNLLEELAGLEGPAPPQVLRQFFQHTEFRRQVRLDRDTMPVGLLNLQFLYHCAHIGGLVLILFITTSTLAQRNLVSLLVVGEKVRPKGLLRNGHRGLADVHHRLRGAIKVE